MEYLCFMIYTRGSLDFVEEIISHNLKGIETNNCKLSLLDDYSNISCFVLPMVVRKGMLVKIKIFRVILMRRDLSTVELNGRYESVPELYSIELNEWETPLDHFVVVENETLEFWTSAPTQFLSRNSPNEYLLG
jgi:hypothetical protein